MHLLFIRYAPDMLHLIISDWYCTLSANNSLKPLDSDMKLRLLVPYAPCVAVHIMHLIGIEPCARFRPFVEAVGQLQARTPCKEKWARKKMVEVGRGNNLPKVVRRHLCLWETILSRNQGWFDPRLSRFWNRRIHQNRPNVSASSYSNQPECECVWDCAKKVPHNAMASSLKGERCSRGDSIIAFFLIIAQRKEIQRQKHLFHICSAIATKLFVTRCRCIPPFLVSKWKLFQNNHWVSSDRNGNFKSLKILRRRSQPGIASCEVVKFSD